VSTLVVFQKKIMFNTAVVREYLHDAEGYGYHFGDVKFDWAKVKSKRDAYIKNLNKSYEDNLKKDGVTYIAGEAKFVDSHTIRVGDQTYTGKHVLIATGSTPTIPDIEGKELAQVSDDFFYWEQQPKKSCNRRIRVHCCRISRNIKCIGF